jgi:hypothetical protein
MAPRVKATNVTTRDDPDGSYPESSPDPLAASITEARVRRIAARPKQPLTSSSPSKQNRVSGYAEIESASPSKSMVLSTPRGGGASPWRIKVTVEAEPGSDEENMESPTVKRVTRTKTTTVPLKDADATSPVKRRGRPRKSETTSAKAKRSGTPVKRTANSKARASSIGAEGSAADVDTDAPAKKRRGRPRKSIQPPTEDEETLAVEESSAPVATVFDDSPSKEPEVEKAVQIEDDVATIHTPLMSMPVIETTFATPQEQQQWSAKDKVADKTCLLPPARKHDKTPQTLKAYEEPMRFTPLQTELSQKIRARKGTPAHKTKVVLEISSDEESDEDSGIHTPLMTDEDAPEVRNQPTVEPAEIMEFEAPEDDDYIEEDGVQDATNFAFEEGATRMPDDTTILESENFSMVSVDSLPSSGGLTSPAYGPMGRTPTGPSQGTTQDSAYLKIPPAELPQLRNSPAATSDSSHSHSYNAQTAALVNPSLPVAPSRHKTPSIESRSPSHPPPIVAAQLSPTEAATPKIGRVVKAGVALQGLLDPNRVTPEAGPSKLIDEDLFRGFSERTRKELQAGLRLGEQLAQQGPPSVRNSPALSSPIKARMEGNAGDDVFAPRAKDRKSRLLTPEDQDDYKMASPPATHVADVQYPSLNISDPESQLLSPARSEDEMSWRVDTPPVRGNTARFMTVSNEAGQAIRGREINKSNTAGSEHKQSIHGGQVDGGQVDGGHRNAQNNDIWEEEASRSSDSLESNLRPADELPQLQDLFAQDGLVKPARGKLPKTWRRKSSGNFQYSDEAEEIPDRTPSSTESDEAPTEKVDKCKAKMVESVIQEDDYDEEDEMSEGSDDTGMFFMNNLPSVFNKRRSKEFRKKKAEKLDLSLLIHEGESLLPESSPPVAKAQTPGISKLNPFLDTPPRFAALQSSPVKSSPLRHEIRASDTFSESISIQQGFEESTLPLPPSSPFHTQVDSESVLTAASDQRQFREEMAAATDSSLRNIRNEADDYLDAYEAQERTLGEIEEVTEPSRTWNKETTAISQCSPVKQAFEESMLRPARTYPSLFGGESASAESTSSKTLEAKQTSERKMISNPQPTVKEPDQPSQPSSGVFGRLTSTLWTALGSPPSPPSHPILTKFDRLPKIEPWTKTHYKTLDALYQRHKKRPTLFLPSPSARTTNTNNSILEDFLRRQTRPFVGARYSVWGYSVTLSESLVVLCAVYMQLLVLQDVFEYERAVGKEIQMGDCGPGVSGEEILAEEVMKRLATVIMGEELRKDEKRGVEVDRSGGLTIMWPA